MRVPTARNGPVCDFDRTVTPMVDVVFQLLVFFVLASGGRMAEQTLSTVLPAGNIAAAETAVTPKRATDQWIHISQTTGKKRTVARFNGREFENCAGLRDALRECGKTAAESRVILDVAKEVPLGDVIFVYDACRAARFYSVNFAASPEEVAEAPKAQMANAPRKTSLGDKR